MKKTRFILILLFSFLIMFSLAACGDLAGNKDDEDGGGIPATMPEAPQNFTATPGDGQVELSWSAPESDGGAPISKYEVSSDSGGIWVTADSSTSHVFTGLTNGMTYTFKVRAVNKAGDGISATKTATPNAPAVNTAPSAPRDFTATPGDGRIELTWAAPSSNGGSEILRYEISTDYGITWATASSNTGHTYTGLTNGTEYVFRVRAVNAVGESEHATAFTTPAVVPSAPIEFGAKPGNGQVELSWLGVESNGGSRIINFEVSSDNGVTWVTSSNSTSHTFTGLTNGTLYTFKVRAVNAIGGGAAATITSTPVYKPLAPQSFTATPGDKQVALSWSAPTSDGGMPVTEYSISINNTSWITPSSNTGHTYTGLSNGLEYTFAVLAVNALGAGEQATVKAIPGTVPSEPRSFYAAPGNGQIVLTWIAPANNGGSEILRYEVSSDNGAAWVTASSSTKHTFTGLTNSTLYNFKVRAVNAIGNGAEASRSATPLDFLLFTLINGGTGYSVKGSDTAKDNSELVIPSTYKGLPVTAIEVNAFKNFNALTSVTIPNSIKSIGDSAFEYCYGLKSATIPDSVISIGDSAFGYCSGLSSISLPFVGEKSDGTGKTYIGHIFGALSYSDNASKLPTGLKTVVITTDAKIGEYAFYGCSNITNMTVPNSITTIGRYAFSGCSGLKSFTIPENLLIIEEYVFSGCGLSSIVIPSKVTSIGAYAFSNCGFTSLTIPENVTSIGLGAFEGCSIIASVTIPFVGEKADGTGSALFGHIFGSEDPIYQDQKVPRSLDAVVITGSSKIGVSAFDHCRSITSITIPNSVTSIGSNAFSYCESLTSIVLPDSLTKILSSTFSMCKALVSIVIPSSVTIVDYYAFSDCTKLTKVYYGGGTIEEWNSISISSSYNTYLTGAAKYFYSETEILDGKHWRFADGVPAVWAIES